jgi:hypothetical protein
MHQRLLGLLQMTSTQAELCFHACWLQQAVDERRLRQSDRLPFLEIVAWLAARRGDFALFEGG